MNDIHFDRAALDAAVRFLTRIGTEESRAHADAVERLIAQHEALSDRYLEETAILRGMAGRLREVGPS